MSKEGTGTGRMEIRKTVMVERALEDTFRIFTEEMGSWWPLPSHSVFEDRAVDAVVEGRAGGLIYEIGADGDRSVWGEVMVWDPPRFLRVSWHPNPAATVSTTWEVRFSPVGTTGTRLDLLHTGWEALGDTASGAHESYSTGWDTVLGGLTDHAGRTP